MNQLSRRRFIGGLSTAATVMATGRAFAAGRILSSLGEPLLRFGVVSDIHVSAEAVGEVLKPGTLDQTIAAFRYFDAMKADAVVIAGDMANSGRVAELLAVGKAWDEAFPGGKGSDGRPVEKVFVYGNHDPGRWPKFNTHGEKLIADDLEGSWEKAFHEPFEPVYRKTVKGYDFVGVHWGNEGRAAEAIDAAGKSGKPFFHIQHPHVKGTVYGGNVWGQDNGRSFAALSKWPQAISFSGHSHSPLENEQSIWQGAFTAIGTASLRYVSISSYRYTQFPRGYENGAAGKGNTSLEPKVMPGELYHTDMREGLLVSVYADKIVLTRRDFASERQIGEDWVLPLSTAERPFDLAARRAKAVPPQFGDGAKLELARVRAKVAAGDGKGGEVDAWELRFPQAKGAYEYEITGTGPDGKPVVSWVYATKSATRLAASRFAADNVRFTVVPLDSLGCRGRGLSAQA